METMNSSLQMQTDDWLMRGVRIKLAPWLHREWSGAWGAHDVRHKAATESYLLVGSIFIFTSYHTQYPFTRYDGVLQTLISPSMQSGPLPLTRELGVSSGIANLAWKPSPSFQQSVGESISKSHRSPAKRRITYSYHRVNNPVSGHCTAAGNACCRIRDAFRIGSDLFGAPCSSCANDRC